MVCSSKMYSCWTLDNERFSSDKIIAAEGDLNKILAAEKKGNFIFHLSCEDFVCV